MTDTADREIWLRANIVRLAEECFPDDAGLAWPVLGVEHRGELAYVEVEPKPATVGYPRFKFVVSFQDPAKPGVKGCYCLDRGKWKLLFNEDPGKLHM